MSKNADVVVIGLGAMGSAALYRLARAGVEVLGIDRFHPPHGRGSSHGESRITRLAVGEGIAYAPLVKRSHEIWAELKAETGETLFEQTGGLIMGPREGVALHHGKSDFVRRSISVAQAQQIPHEVLETADIACRFPQFALRGDEIAYFEPSAGRVFPEKCIEVQLTLAEHLGARLGMGETVISVRQLGQGCVEIVTDKRTLNAARVILAAGAWMPTLASPDLGALTKIYRQTLHWFSVADPALYASGRFPVFIWFHGDREEDYLYGFPVMPGADCVKVASEQYRTTTDVNRFDSAVDSSESANLYERHVAGRLLGVSSPCIRSAACLYTVTPDSGFIIDRDTDRPDLLVASACSGHGFKHSAAIGELLASQAMSSDAFVSNPFASARFA